MREKLRPIYKFCKFLAPVLACCTALVRIVIIILQQPGWWTKYH